MNTFFQDIDDALPAEMTPNMLHSCCRENVFLRLHSEAVSLKNTLGAKSKSAAPVKPRDPKSLVAEELGTLAWQLRKAVTKGGHVNYSSSSSLSSSSTNHCSEPLRGPSAVPKTCRFVLERLQDEVAAHKVECSKHLVFAQQDSVQCHMLRSPCLEVQFHSAGKAVCVTVAAPCLASAEDSACVTEAFGGVGRELTDAFVRGQESFFIAFYAFFKYINSLLLSTAAPPESVLRAIVGVCSRVTPGVCGAITTSGIRVHYGKRPGGKALLGGYLVPRATAAPAATAPAVAVTVVAAAAAAATATTDRDPTLRFDLLFEGPPVVFSKSSFLLAVGRSSAEQEGLDTFTRLQETMGVADAYSYERLASGVSELAKIKGKVKVDDSTTFCFGCFGFHSAMTVARIPLPSVSELSRTLSLVARQVAFNRLFASCFRSYSSSSSRKKSGEEHEIAVAGNGTDGGEDNGCCCCNEEGCRPPPQKKPAAAAATTVKLEIIGLEMSEEPAFTFILKAKHFNVLISVDVDGVVTAEYNGTPCDLLAKMLNLTYNIPFSLHRYMKTLEGSHSISSVASGVTEATVGTLN